MMSEHCHVNRSCFSLMDPSNFSLITLVWSTVILHIISHYISFSKYHKCDKGKMNFLLLLLYMFMYLDNEPPGISGCPDDAIIPAASTTPVPHSWVPPVFSDNSNQSVYVVFGCSATVTNECHQDGYGNFSVGDTEVMYNGTDTSGNHNFCNFTVTVKGLLCWKLPVSACIHFSL